MNMLSLVCIYAQEGPWEPLVSPTVLSFSLLHRWAALKVKPAPLGIVKESGWGFLTVMVSAHQVLNAASRGLSTYPPRARHGVGRWQWPVPLFGGHKVRQGKDHLCPYGRAAPCQGTGY